MQQADFYEKSYNPINTGATRDAEKLDGSTTELGGWVQEDVSRDW